MSNFFLWTTAILAAFFPALLWLIIWYKKDSKEPEPKTMIVRAFLFGMLGILPFFGIQYALESSPNLVEIWQIIEKYSFFTATILLAFLLAALEEFVKHFSVLRLGKKLDIHFTQIVDGIVYSVSVALGFSFMENVLYFMNILLFTGISSEFWSVFFFRSFGTMLGHTLFSGLFGYFWGYAFFSKRICAKHTESVSRLWRIFQQFLETLRFHIIFSHVLRGRPSQRKHEKSQLMREAFLLSTVFHTIFNLLLTSQVFGAHLTPFVAPLLVGGSVFLFHRFGVPENVKIWKAV